jgi:hypothetical protein
MTTQIQIIGLKETLKELNRIEPELRKDFNKRGRDILTPIVNDAKTNIPTLPLSGFARSWRKGEITPWDQSKVRRSIATKIDTRRNAVAVLKVTMKSAAGSVFDMAGRRRANPLATQLNRYGLASRVMWAAYNRHQDTIEKGIQELANDLTEAVNRRLVR